MSRWVVHSETESTPRALTTYLGAPGSAAYRNPPRVAIRLGTDHLHQGYAIDFHLAIHHLADALTAPTSPTRWCTVADRRAARRGCRQSPCHALEARLLSVSVWGRAR